MTRRVSPQIRAIFVSRALTVPTRERGNSFRKSIRARPAVRRAAAPGRPLPAARGTVPMREAAGIEPLFDICAQPADGPAAELLPLWESADDRERSEYPTMTPRQTCDVVRSQNLIPSWDSFVDPAGKRYVVGRDRRPGDRSQPRVFDAHGRWCSYVWFLLLKDELSRKREYGPGAQGCNAENRRIFGVNRKRKLGLLLACS